MHFRLADYVEKGELGFYPHTSYTTQCLSLQLYGDQEKSGENGIMIFTMRQGEGNDLDDACLQNGRLTRKRLIQNRGRHQR